MTLGKARSVCAALVILTGLTSCSHRASPVTILTIQGPWTGAEQKDFDQVINFFNNHHHGIHASYKGYRDIGQVLQSEVQNGDAPDLADLSSPEAVAYYASQGDIYPLDKVLNSREITQSYSPQWLQLDMAGTHYIYAVTVKADVKSIIWYDPQRLPEPPATWDQLLAFGQQQARGGTAPWCLGVADTTASGWPGTDWIADILLHQSGELAYQKWTDGTLQWTSSQVRDAWQTWGEIVAPGQVYGGSISSLVTDYNNAGAPMFDLRPGCDLDHEGSFIMADYELDSLPGGGHPQPGTNFDFFQFPEIGPAGSTAVQVSADFMSMFRNSPQAREFIRFLATKQAQEIWPEIAGGGAFSVDQKVPPSIYKNPASGKTDQVSAGIAAILASHSNTLCFDAADLMPEAMQTAFYLGVLEYLQNPNQLTAILQGLDNVRIGAYPAGGLSFTCGTR
jgi:alpha-glucoside transport system substrate-binding protein